METNKVICGDCRQIMNQWDNGCIDMVFTDPPYNLGKDYGKTYNDSLNWPEYWQQYENWFTEIFRIARDPSMLYVSCIPAQIFIIKPLLEDIGWKYCQFLVWHSRNCFIAGKCSKKRINQPWTMTFETILVFRKGKYIRMLNIPTALTFDVITISSPQSNFKENKRFQIGQKPLRLIYNIIQRTPGELIFDPFLGSGTTAVAAKQLNRKYIGIEINPKYCKIAEERLLNIDPLFHQGEK